MAGRRPVLELLKANKTAERVLIARELAPSGVIGEIRRRAEALNIPVRLVPKDEIGRVAPDLNHQGVVALAGRFRYAQLDDLLSLPAPAVLFLDGITDPHNLGSLLRSADGAGFHGVVIPARRAVGVTSAVRRVAAGAAEVVPVARVGNMSSAIEQARSAGLWVVGLAHDGDEDVWSCKLLETPVGLLLGSEDKGISHALRSHCDALARIPSSGKIESLNVGVAGAIAMFEVARRTSNGTVSGLR